MHVEEPQVVKITPPLLSMLYNWIMVLAHKTLSINKLRVCCHVHLLVLHIVSLFEAENAEVSLVRLFAPTFWFCHLCSSQDR